jgi:hypothetical protein
MTQPPDVTGLLVAWSNGDGAANDRVIEAVHAELRALARSYLAGASRTALGVTPITVKCEWAPASAWLFRELRGDAR